LHFWIILLSVSLIIALFYLLNPLDRPTLLMVHEFADPFIEQIGSLGNSLGKGETLVIISLTIGAFGLYKKTPQWKFAGLYTLLAHGLSGLITQILKRSLGRPRPRLMETTSWEVGFSLESGWDSFPSGHTSASFSVATVLAYYFPGGRMLWFGLAGYVGICRVITGAHFPTDVLGGMLIGVGSGLILVYARDEWKEAVVRAFAHGLPWLVTAFAFLWILVPHPDLALEPNLSLTIGLMLIVAGLGLRLWWIWDYWNSNISVNQAVLEVPLWPRLLMGLGLAISTGSLIVTGAALLAGTIWWLGIQAEHMTPKAGRRGSHCISGFHPVWSETALGTGMLLLTLLVFSIRSTLLVISLPTG
jgi:membrane-associated phospholipid phosphatase